MKDKGVRLMEPPERKGRYTRYWIDAELSARDALGIGWPYGEKLKWLQVEGFCAGAESIRQFRLEDGRRALAMYDSRFFYSLVLIYRSPRNRGSWASVGTKGASLEAWLLRTKPHDQLEKFLPLEVWQHFLGSCTEDRARYENAFRLEGSARVREDDLGLIKQMLDVELHSLKPLPAFKEYRDFDEKRVEGEIAEREANPKISRHQIEKMKVEWASWRAFRRQHKPSEPAVFSGWVRAGWAGPPWNIVWP
jgi:hypothetical protein